MIKTPWLIVLVELGQNGVFDMFYSDSEFISTEKIPYNCVKKNT